MARVPNGGEGLSHIERAGDGADQILEALWDIRRSTWLLYAGQKHSPAHYQVLRLLRWKKVGGLAGRPAAAGGGPLTSGDVARYLELTPSATSQMLGLLESQGLVRRQPSEQDRRQIHVLLTDAGERQLAEFHKAFRLKLRRILKRLDPQDAADLVRILGTLRQLIREETDADEAPSH